MRQTAFVNLTTANVRISPSDGTLLERFLGGRGLGARLLYEHVGPQVDPLASDSLLIFTVGPLCGTAWPTSARTHVTFKSPLTGAYGYSNSGGFFGPELAHAGFDALVISGRAPQPVILRVKPGHVTIEPAGELWGQETGAVHRALAPGKEEVACIGPAGENGVRVAAIINDVSRAAARCGGGAVMGSKQLKAIVVSAEGAPRPDPPPAFLDAARTASRRLSTDPRLEGLRTFGTSFLVSIKNASGDLPAKNHQLPQVPFVAQVDAEALHRYVLRGKGCYACPIRCGRVTRVESGPYACDLGGPEYETIDALGPMVWLDDIEALIYANLRCNELGLDTISTGVIIAFAMECHQRGLLNDPTLSLEWGDADTVLGLIERIARREGLGDLLADGVRRAAGHIGPEAIPLAMHVKGMELPRQEPRFAKGFGLGHATANRGADHLYGLPSMDIAANLEAAQRFFPPEVVPRLLDPVDEAYKPDMVILGEHYCALSDALGVCKFSTVEAWALLPDDLAAGLSALWGRGVTGEELLTIGERIVNLERWYNTREGLSRADDYLPARFSEPAEVWAFEADPDTGEVGRSSEPVRTGVIFDLDVMLDRYYQLRGWSPDGIPVPETLHRLGLDDL